MWGLVDVFHIFVSPSKKEAAVISLNVNGVVQLRAGVEGRPHHHESRDNSPRPQNGVLIT